MTINVGAEFHRLLAQASYDRAGHIRVQRFLLLRRLRMAGVSDVFCTYDAYGDSGNFEDVMLDDGSITAKDDLIVDFC